MLACLLLYSETLTYDVMAEGIRVLFLRLRRGMGMLHHMQRQAHSTRDGHHKGVSESTRFHDTTGLLSSNPESGHDRLLHRLVHLHAVSLH